MAAILYNDWYVAAADYYSVGPASGTPSANQQHNADKIISFLQGLSWSNNAIAAVLGNMQLESNLNPARVYPISGFPNGGATLADIDNSIAINHPDPAYGLVQWKGTTTTPPAGNQLVSYAIRHNYQWYDGDIQLQRLQWEYTEGVKFHPQTVDGTYWTFADFASSTADVNTLVKVWMVCYEGTYSRLDERKANGRYWLDYIGGQPPAPVTGWIPGEQFASIAYGYKDSGYTYDQYDCIGFVNLCWQHIDNPPKTESLTNGTNSIWRSSRTFPTTDPNGNNPTLELWWKGTLSECESYFGGIPTGILLFRCIPEGQPGYDTIPAQYRGDGIGNFTHVGIYINPVGGSEYVIMQSGGYGGTGVHQSKWRDNYWTHAAFPVYVGINDIPPEPPEPDPEDILSWLLLWYTNQKGGVKRVRK